MSMRVGYARVSTVGQKLDLQLDRLSDCDRIFKEKASAATTEKRPILKEALDFVRVGDVLLSQSLIVLLGQSLISRTSCSFLSIRM